MSPVTTIVSTDPELLANALESGCPQLVLPLAWDQPDNTARVTRLGVGISLGSRQRSSGHITRTLARLMTLEVRARCLTVAAQDSEKNGLEIAARWVEELVAKTPYPSTLL